MGGDRLRYVSYEDDRHGKPRVYVRRHGRRLRIREKPGSAAFIKAVALALDRLERPESIPTAIIGARKGTLGWLAEIYFASVEFKALDVTSQRTRKAIIENCLAHTIAGAGTLVRDCPLPQITAAKLKALRDAKAEFPGAANKRLQYLSAMFAWAIEDGKMQKNPARDVRKLKYATDGFHPWTVSELAQFENRHPIGTKARLALALLLFLGVRRGDVVCLGPKNIRDGAIHFVPRKLRHKRLDVSTKPILPELAAIIAASPTGNATFLETSHGKPFSAAGFGNWFRERCNEAGLPQCSAHGLRKAGAARAAENGATVHQLMAIFDWLTPQQAEVYTRAADRRRMAADGMPLLATAQSAK